MPMYQVQEIRSCEVPARLVNASDSLRPEELLPAPGFAAKIDSDCVLAVGAVMDGMLIVLDIEQLMLSPAIGLTSPSTH
jgi:chemotaxis signal transduction protein